MPASAQQTQARIARREHECENAVDDDEGEGGSAGIAPAYGEMQFGVDLVPGVVVDDDGGEFDEEEDPLHSPGEDEVMNQRAGGLGMRESDSEPDADAADGAEDGGEDEEKLREAGQLVEPVGAELACRHLHGFALGHGQIEAAADGEQRDHHMKDGDDADHPAGAEVRDVPKRIIHGFTESSNSR
jgi:hypothetical protein